jgi:enterochelin esterase family protein
MTIMTPRCLCVARTFGVLALCLAAAAAQAQQPPAGSAGGGRGRGRSAVVSPEVAADRTVTFRFQAPNAREVSVAGTWGGAPIAMSRDANGIWTATVGPLPVDIYTYSFNADGIATLDPRNTNTKMGYGGFGPVSTVEVAGDGPQFYDMKPVPHGEVRILPYESTSLGLSRSIWVYTPPGYDKGSNYPVLYLLHGAGDIESGWVLVGRANAILDNLIAERKARPMVVVMPLGHAIQGFYNGPAKAVAAPARVGGPGSPGALTPFAHDLLEDVIPLVQRTYKVSKTADDRAIGGLSMGGGQSINVAFNRPELFRYVILMSPATPPAAEQAYADLFRDPAAVNRQFKLLWLGVGKDDTLVGNGVRNFEGVLAAKHITHDYVVTEGAHEWTVWRHHLNDVAPRLFK